MHNVDQLVYLCVHREYVLYKDGTQRTENMRAEVTLKLVEEGLI